MKKRILKTIGVFMLTVILGVNMNVNLVLARDFSKTNGSHTFSTAWEETAYFNSGSKLVYGFNTFLVNEDYSHSNEKYSVAYVTNANGTFKGKAALTTTWSKCETPHAGTSITYGVTY